LRCEGSIVGRGNHSANHVQKLKPRVERVCQELGLRYTTEENAGRLYIDLTGGQTQTPQRYGQTGGYQQQQQQYGGQQYQQGGGYPGQQQPPQQQYGAGQPNDQNAEMEAAVKKYLPRILRKLEGCCIVM